MSVLDSLSREIAAVATAARPSVLHLRVLAQKGMATGTGFLALAPGLALTNAHVVGG